MARHELYDLLRLSILFSSSSSSMTFDTGMHTTFSSSLIVSSDVARIPCPVVNLQLPLVSGIWVGFVVSEPAAALAAISHELKVNIDDLVASRDLFRNCAWQTGYKLAMTATLELRSSEMIQPHSRVACGRFSASDCDRRCGGDDCGRLFRTGERNCDRLLRGDDRDLAPRSGKY